MDEELKRLLLNIIEGQQDLTLYVRELNKRIADLQFNAILQGKTMVNVDSKITTMLDKLLSVTI